MTAPSTAPLPVLTTLLLERRERAYLAWVAVANEIAELPLEAPPIDGATHALEIHADGFDEPLVVLADPMGEPTEQGFPLRLRPLDDAQESLLRSELFAGRTEPASAPPPSSTESSAISRRSPGWLTGRILGDGRFVLEQLLGGGASGEVYRAHHVALRRSVAVKVLHPSLQHTQDYCTRFYAEALSVSRLDHRNVLRVLDYGQEADGLLYIVMELLEGKSIQDILDIEGPLPEPRAIDLVSQACAGLAHAHDAGLIHRDIKPENLVVVRWRDDDGLETELVKVCDFGIAHWSQPEGTPDIGDDDRTLVKMPDATKIVGTPVYMSPEQIQNTPVDARTDVYSLGVVLYELTTGHVPYLYDDAMEILTAHLVEDPTPPRRYAPEMTPRLEEVILKALSKDPDSRQRDARELRAEIRAIVAGDARGSAKLKRFSVPFAATDFVNDPTNTLAAMDELDGKERSAAFRTLADALKLALTQGKTKPANELLAWTRARLPTLEPGEAELAQSTLVVLRDPDVARAHAINLLDGKIDRTEDALAVLREAGPVGARALIEARRLRSATLELRAQFGTILRAIGAPAVAVIVSALEPLTALATRQDEALAEDLLRAIPEGRSDSAGEVTVRFVRLDKPALGIAALRATTMLWGPRARSILVRTLDATDDAFRTLALEELHKLGAIDDAVVDRLGRLLNGPSPAGDPLKIAAASALGGATTDAQPRAIAWLTARLAPAQGFMGSLRSALGSRESIRVTIALARSLHVLDPAGSRGVLQRLASTRPELRAHLDAILAGR